jgi:hypothetical protein
VVAVAAVVTAVVVSSGGEDDDSAADTAPSPTDTTAAVESTSGSPATTRPPATTAAPPAPVALETVRAGAWQLWSGLTERLQAGDPEAAAAWVADNAYPGHGMDARACLDEFSVDSEEAVALVFPTVDSDEFVVDDGWEPIESPWAGVEIEGLVVRHPVWFGTASDLVAAGWSPESIPALIGEWSSDPPPEVVEIAKENLDRLDVHAALFNGQVYFFYWCE